MGPQNSTEPITVAQALRDAADWLDLHPEVTASYGFVPVRTETREDLETLAAALGDRATEQVSYGNEVEIQGIFGPDAFHGGVRVYGRVPVAKLTDQPVVQPPYRQILPPADESDDDRLERLTGEGRR